MKILFAVDASPTCEAVIEHLASRPWPKDTIFGILHVINSKDWESTAGEIERGLKQEMQAAHDLVNAAAERLTAQGVEVSTAVIVGNPRLAIIEYAKLWNVDLVIVGALGMHHIQTFFLGAVAKNVLREAPCSVEVIRPLETEQTRLFEAGMKILLATDGTDESLAAILSVANRPWPEGSEVRVVSVVEPLESLAVYWDDHSTVQNTIEETNRLLARKAIADAEFILSNEGFATSSTLLMGNPKEVIVEEGQNWGADLIVVGTRATHGRERIQMGSVSDAVATHAACSVEVVRKH
ncbi:MAG: universal stress protein [Blastocatellia bacterium]|nr:universal stress protein [Blastocatellia bacterium]